MFSLFSTSDPAISPEAPTNSCHHTSNNKHSKCPPRMNDGRHFTDYRPSCYLNNIIQESNTLHNSNQMRMFLTHNATELMQLNRRKACDRNCCGPCQKPYQTGTMMPEAYAEVVGTPIPCGSKSSQSSVVEAHSNAPLTCSAWDSGDGRTYGNNTCSTVQNLANTYPVSADGVVVSRKSSPGGGVVPVTDRV